MSSGKEFHGKIALVTGGGSGIGRSVCQILARGGARVSVCDINLKAAQETLATLQQPGDHVALQMNVADKASVREALTATQGRLEGTPTLLVNSAGIGRRSTFLEMSEEAFMEVVDVNLKGTFLVSQLVCNAILERDAAKGASVVNIASLAGKNGLAMHSQYAATKGGVMAFTKSCAKELAKTGIRVNCVLPGAIRTPMMANVSAEIMNEVLKINALGRSGEPEEVAELIVFLLSEKSSYMVGACVEVTGGHMA
ncbi:estradiol 17-beta-dehydrogenase 8-like [Penaeus japonicus]|uniref:estradiol 17-beta-dehydrogenase 8-like n=1 Tax=Penaeus japonicus TaxID=27405 RepID=UPI001C715913|nr:estradiol 17-beta-dehydrogenase 8-like [Penaeus japonicus]